MLVGQNVTLRAWRDSDLEVLTALRNDSKLQAQLMTQPRPNSTVRVRQWLSEKSSRTDGVFFIVATQKEDRAIGYVQVLNLDLLNGHGDLGICVSPAAQGQGYGRETLALLEVYLRRTFALRKLMLQALADNAGALAFYHECGYGNAGRLTEHFYTDGRFCDVVLMEKFLST